MTDSKTDKKYIKPYKIAFLKCYKNFILKFNELNSIFLESTISLDYIQERKQSVRIALEDLACAFQIENFTNQYRVSLIRKFEIFLFKRAFKKYTNCLQLNTSFLDVENAIMIKNLNDIFLMKGLKININDL